MGILDSARSRSFNAARLLSALLLTGLAALLVVASPAAAQKLVTIDASSSYVDPSNQNLAGPVTGNMGPTPAS
ncbi:MAG: hypothetical protein QG596_613 [Actinomycetota bacterium]|jgi:spermidine/putrescine-binding protein|nr:hypothetical protein [Actinomycetota bacterium]